ncbi:MAG: hypothetical protein JEY96_16030 [Bacteroidales bacterium]|nr:hypothetical protein [Bacteroidales bacterium]
MKSGLISYKKVLAVIFTFFVSQLHANENEKIEILNAEFKIDFMSMHTWRGFATSKSPTIEPSFEITRNNSTSGIWLAHSLDGNYSELDLYFKYSLKSFSFAIYDYYCPPSYRESDEITNFDKYSTNHTIELDAAFNATQNFPISILVATMVYGDDKNSETNENRYSTYFQFSYSTTIDNNNINLALGFNAFESYYGDKFGVVNASIGIARTLKAFKSKEIPLQAAIITNPLANSIFLKFGFTL